MLTGCVQQVFFSHVNAATARVLAAEGCEVITPADQPCCGALMVHSGLEEQAAAMARNHHRHLRSRQRRHHRHQRRRLRLHDEGVRPPPPRRSRNGPRAPPPSPQSAKTSPRSSANFRQSRRAIRCPCASPITTPATCVTRRASSSSRATCSQRFRSLEVAEIAESSLCCGSAGVYNLLQPEPAQRARRPQGRPSARHAASGCRLRQSRLPAAAHERPAPPRRANAPRLPHGRAAGRIHSRRVRGQFPPRKNRERARGTRR